MTNAQLVELVPIRGQLSEEYSDIWKLKAELGKKEKVLLKQLQFLKEVTRVHQGIALNEQEHSKADGYFFYKVQAVCLGENSRVGLVTRRSYRDTGSNISINGTDGIYPHQKIVFSITSGLSIEGAKALVLTWVMTGESYESVLPNG